MFTGLIEDIGTVCDVQRTPEGARLDISAPGMAGGVALGESVAVNGVCLTVIERSGNRFAFDAVPETLARSSLGSLKKGVRVNLERALAVGQRMGGHFVQGHVDGTGALADVRKDGNAKVLTIDAPRELMRYMAPKSSVALDGISLTLVDVTADRFTVWIVPHTWENTNLQFRSVGDSLNIEVDLIARHIERLLSAREDSSGQSEVKTAAAGFVE
jgi:riboflavin synthase